MNWGTKIVLGMLAFMAFIISMVVYMFKVHGDDALVDENYYEKGLDYDTEFDAQKNTLDDVAAPEITVAEQQIVIQLKHAASYQLVLLRPSSAKKDIRSSGKTIGESNLILVDTKHMDKGLWQLNLNWEANGKSYQVKKEIIR